MLTEVWCALHRGRFPPFFPVGGEGCDAAGNVSLPEPGHLLCGSHTCSYELPGCTPALDHVHVRRHSLPRVISWWWGCGGGGGVGGVGGDTDSVDCSSISIGVEPI